MSDPKKDAARAYGVVTKDRRFPYRWTFFISKDGKILKVDKHVKVGAHGKDVAKALVELKVDVK